MYATLATTGSGLFIASCLIVLDRPPTPPSRAQMKAQRSQQSQPPLSAVATSESPGVLQELRKSAAEFMRVMRILFREKVFVSVWILFGASNPVLRNNNVLLSSAVAQSFTGVTGINEKVGFILMLAWAAYTLGGFVTGPIITYTQRYKLVVATGEFFLFLSCVLVFAGVYLKSMAIVYAGMLLQGLMVGSCNTSLFELLAEVSYPQPTMFVTMISIICMGVFRFAYPILGRLLLSHAGATASELFPCVALAACVLISATVRPVYKRKNANEERHVGSDGGGDKSDVVDNERIELLLEHDQYGEEEL